LILEVVISRIKNVENLLEKFIRDIWNMLSQGYLGFISKFHCPLASFHSFLFSLQLNLFGFIELKFIISLEKLKTFIEKCKNCQYGIRKAPV